MPSNAAEQKRLLAQLGFRAAQDDPLDVEQLAAMAKAETLMHGAFKRGHSLATGRHQRSEDLFAAAVRLYWVRGSTWTIEQPEEFAALDPTWSVGIWAEGSGWEEVKNEGYMAYRIASPEGYRVREIRCDVSANEMAAPFIPSYSYDREGGRVHFAHLIAPGNLRVSLSASWQVMFIAYLQWN